jgi:hypothetical protein
MENINVEHYFSEKQNINYFTCALSKRIMHRKTPVFKEKNLFPILKLAFSSKGRIEAEKRSRHSGLPKPYLDSQFTKMNNLFYKRGIFGGRI